MPVSYIDSPQNAIIKSTAKLRTRRGRQLQDRIIIDGLREVQRAVDGGVEIESIFVPAGDIRDWARTGVSVYELSDRAYSKVAFGHRKEVVAVAKTPTRSLDKLFVPDPARIVVLQRLEKPGNVGAILRCADGAGMDAVVLVDAVTDLFNPNAIRASLGTIFAAQIGTATFDEYVAWAGQHNFYHLLAKCAPDAVHYQDVDYRNGCAIVLGGEAKGLSDNWERLRGTSVTIPMAGIADSLNVAAAAAVLFFEATRDRR